VRHADVIDSNTVALAIGKLGSNNPPSLYIFDLGQARTAAATNSHSGNNDITNTIVAEFCRDLRVVISQ
jgi:hypothetical protein